MQIITNKRKTHLSYKIIYFSMQFSAIVNRFIVKTQLNSTFTNDLKRNKKFRKMFIVADLVSLIMIKLIKKILGSNCSIIGITCTCITATCAAEDCLDCSTSTQCRRCAYFLAEGSRECLSTCTGEAKIVYSGDVQGSICVGKFWLHVF